MPEEPSAEVRAKLDEATRARAAEAAQHGRDVAAPEPRRPGASSGIKVHAGEVAGAAAPAGSGDAQYLLVDHFFGGAGGTLWAYSGGTWYAATTNQPADEQGIAMVAFVSNKVEANWGDANDLTLIRCWKYL